MEELIDVLDAFGIKTGIVKEKSQIKKDGNYHRAISVLIINEKNEILMQKRSSNKKVYPNLWGIFVKGHVRSNEDVFDASKREVLEELGILIDTNELEYLYTIKDEKITEDNYIERIFFDTFLIKKNIDINDIVIDTNEVSDVCWCHYKDVLKLIQEGILIPNNYDYEIIFDILEEMIVKDKVYLKR